MFAVVPSSIEFFNNRGVSVPAPFPSLPSMKIINIHVKDI